jgi:hypothetical protein
MQKNLDFWEDAYWKYKQSSLYAVLYKHNSQCTDPKWEQTVTYENADEAAKALLGRIKANSDLADQKIFVYDKVKKIAGICELHNLTGYGKVFANEDLDIWEARDS